MTQVTMPPLPVADELVALALTQHFDGERPQLPAAGALYSIEQGFCGLASYWQDKIRFERFESVKSDAVLYRPEITEELFNQTKGILDRRTGYGIMVKGPHGIGKSHSLVNLVLRLQSTGNYLVTFVPDCALWHDARFLAEMICGSFGFATIEGVALNRYLQGLPDLTPYRLRRLVQVISNQLTSMGKQWVFVFDQINHPFARHPSAETFSVLPFPFNFMKRVNCRGRIISIVSVSASNDINIDHPAFHKYKHTTEMTDTELDAVFGKHASIADGSVSLAAAKAAAGGVPHYVNRFLSDYRVFQANINAEVGQSIESMKRDPDDWPQQEKSVICSVLEISPPWERLYAYDKKYLVRDDSAGVDHCRYKTLFPAVETAYRTHLRDTIMRYIRQDQSNLLGVCYRHHATKKSVDRLFKYMVIQEIISNGLVMNWSDSGISVERGAPILFDGLELPAWPKANGVWIPTNANFPAIDFFVKSGPVAVGFNIHVSCHLDVAPDFYSMCEASGWFSPDVHGTVASRTRSKSNPSPQIVLAYLSPNDTAKRQAMNSVKSICYSPLARTGCSGVKRSHESLMRSSTHPSSCKRAKPFSPRMSLVALTSSQVQGLECLVFSSIGYKAKKTW
jgi:hypothetical protein